MIQKFQLQAAAALHDDPGQLLASLVERYGVTEWFKTGCPRPYAEDEIARKMANSCLQLILALIAERYADDHSTSYTIFLNCYTTAYDDMTFDTFSGIIVEWA